MKLAELIYTSRMTAPLSMVQIVAILDAARANNLRHGVTGMLTYGSDRFLQCIEGPPEAVNRLYCNLVADPRHTHVMLLGYRAIPQRRFSRWSMGFYIPGDDGSFARNGLPPDRFDPESMSFEQAVGLLADMATRMEFAAAI